MKKAILTCIIILGFMQANAENPPRSYFQFKAEFASVLKPVHGYTETNKNTYPNKSILTTDQKVWIGVAIGAVSFAALETISRTQNKKTYIQSLLITGIIQGILQITLIQTEKNNLRCVY